MRVCFIGIGSIALRHITNLRNLYGHDINISALRSGEGKDLSDSEMQMIDNVIYRYDEMGTFDIVFITNPTSLHYETLIKTIDKADAFFIEKPVFMTGDEDCKIFKREGKTIYVACPLRYSNVIQYVKNSIDISTVYSARSICSSYLPDWRPGTDYRCSYSASSKKGGGVSIDLIHEWDYLVHLFGYPSSVKNIISKKSKLEIDADDIAVYIAEYRDRVIELHLDYFGRKSIRQLELFTKDDTIVCDLYKQEIKYLCSGKKVNIYQERDDYQKRELEHFMKIVSGQISNDNDIENACATLRIALGQK